MLPHAPPDHTVQLVQHVPCSHAALVPLESLISFPSILLFTHVLLVTMLLLLLAGVSVITP